jgi:LysM repeat protein
MRRKALGKHGWSISIGLLLCTCVGVPAHAASRSSPLQVAIGSPLPDSLVGGRITMSVAYNVSTNPITAFTVYVDDTIQYSRAFQGTGATRGIQYLELDTRTIPDGNHTIKVAAAGKRGTLDWDSVTITVRNGVAGGPDLTPPLVQFRRLMDGDTVSGMVDIDVLAEDNSPGDLLVSIFVNQRVTWIKNRAPYTMRLNTADFLNPATNTGSIVLEAWAYDKATNVGKTRPLRLEVRPAGPSPQQTPKQGDPETMPVLPEMAGNTDPEPIRETTPPAPGPRPQMGAGAPDVPPSAPGDAIGHPVTPQSDRVPGSRPSSPRMAKQSAAVIEPDLDPVGGSSSLSASKPAVPNGAVRPAARLTPRPAEVAVPEPVRSKPGVTGPKRIHDRAGLAGSPELLRSDSQGGTLSGIGPRATLPRMAMAKPRALYPEVPVVSPAGPPAGSTAALPSRGPGSARPIIGGQRSSAPAPELLQTPAGSGRLSQAAPRTTTPGSRPAGQRLASAVLAPSQPEIAAMARTAPQAALPLLPTHPASRPAGPRDTIPTVRPAQTKPAIVRPRTQKPQPVRAARPARVARAAAPDPLIVAVVDPDATPNQAGRVPVKLYRPKPAALKPVAPKDRSYRTQRGDTIASVARKFRVSPRSIMVANGMTGGSSLRSGSVIKVPGTFDVVLNDSRVAFDVNPRVENGLSLAPFRQMFEHAGGVVVWYPDQQEVRAANPQKEVRLQIGSKEAKVNQVVVVMDREAFIDSGRTIVPVSFMEKALDLKAEYDVKTGTIILAPR